MEHRFARQHAMNSSSGFFPVESVSTEADVQG